MKIVIAEFVLGGGLAAETASLSLLREAGMMLQALLAELKPLNLEIGVMLDCRYQHLFADEIEKIIVQPEDDFYDCLERALSQYEVFWPIAPESDQVLARMVETAEKKAIDIIASDRSAIRLCSDKSATIQHLTPFFEVPETHKLVDFDPVFPSTWVIKLIDGAGCEQTFVIDTEALFQATLSEIQPENFIIQRFVPGRAISLSALFRQGKGWLLTVNEQVMSQQDNCLNLSACRVNCVNRHLVRYQQVIDDIAQVIPGLWGYAGIDLIESEDGRLTILEINPRLTTSYAGIFAATGVNIAEKILQLRQGEPLLHFTKDESITVDLNA